MSLPPKVIKALLVLAEFVAKEVAKPPVKIKSPDKRLLRYSDLEAEGYGSRWTIRRKVKLGQFPPPVDLGDSHIGWWRETIDEYDESLTNK